MANRITVQLSRYDAKVPWGLRISGGRDFGAPVTVQRVVPGGLAERAGLCAGDRMIDICGNPAGPMCHRDAQQAIKNAGNALTIEVERSSGPATARPPASATADSIAAPMGRLEVRGDAVEASEPDSDPADINSTAKPWQPRRSIDNTGSASLSRIQGASGYHPIGRQAPSAEPAPPTERKYSTGPMPFQLSASLVNNTSAPASREEKSMTFPRASEERKDPDAGASFRYQPSAEPLEEANKSQGSDVRKLSDDNPYRYQPSSVPVGFSANRGRASEPNITPLQRSNLARDGDAANTNGSAPAPAWQRKVSDTAAPFGQSYRPGMPNVAPKPSPAERRLSLERNTSAAPFRLGSSAAVAAAANSAASTPPPPPPQAPPAAEKRSDNPPPPLAAQGNKAPSQQQSPGVCFHCKETVRGPYLMALDRVYCTDHFRCAKCDDKLDNKPFIAHEGLIYCVADYGKHVAAKCAACGEPVVTDQLRAMDKVYHPHCFVCTLCKEPIAAGSFRLGTDNMPYCEKDWKENFQVICTRCDFPIETDERFIEALSKSYHADCFVCTTCQMKLEGKPFYNRNDHPYCREHINAR